MSSMNIFRTVRTLNKLPSTGPFHPDFNNLSEINRSVIIHIGFESCIFLVSIPGLKGDMVKETINHLRNKRINNDQLVVVLSL